MKTSRVPIIVVVLLLCGSPQIARSDEPKKLPDQYAEALLHVEGMT
jgi:hypothetical protein